MRSNSKLKATAVATSIAFAISGGGVAIAEEAVTETPETEKVVLAASKEANDTQEESTPLVGATATKTEKVGSGEEQTTDEQATDEQTTDEQATTPTVEASSDEETTTEEATNVEATEEGSENTTETTTDEAAGLEAAAAQTDTGTTSTQEVDPEILAVAPYVKNWTEYDQYTISADLTGYPYLIIPTDSELLDSLNVSVNPAQYDPNWLIYKFSKKDDSVTIPNDEWLLGGVYWLVEDNYEYIESFYKLNEVDKTQLTKYDDTNSMYDYYTYRGEAYMVKEGSNVLVRMYGVIPTSGTSSSTNTATEVAHVASVASYIPASQAVPATGSAYVSPTASAAKAESAIPATGDATSFVGAIASAFSSLGAFGAAFALRRRK